MVKSYWASGALPKFPTTGVSSGPQIWDPSCCITSRNSVVFPAQFDELAGGSLLCEVSEFQLCVESLHVKTVLKVVDNEAMFINFDSSQEFKVTVGSATSRKAHCLVDGRCYLDGLPDSIFPKCVRQFVAAPASSRYMHFRTLNPPC